MRKKAINSITKCNGDPDCIETILKNLERPKTVKEDFPALIQGYVNRKISNITKPSIAIIQKKTKDQTLLIIKTTNISDTSACYLLYSNLSHIENINIDNTFAYIVSNDELNTMGSEIYDRFNKKIKESLNPNTKEITLYFFSENEDKNNSSEHKTKSTKPKNIEPTSIVKNFFKKIPWKN